MRLYGWWLALNGATHKQASDETENHNHQNSGKDNRQDT